MHLTARAVSTFDSTAPACYTNFASGHSDGSTLELNTSGMYVRLIQDPDTQLEQRIKQ